MKQILVIGSAVADVIIELEDHLPRTGEDIHVRSQQMRPGGCGFNTYDILRHFGTPSIPFFPVGQGAYGDFLWRALPERGVCSPIPRPTADNGCCYCFIEPDGERTFISYHGAEYRFSQEWFDLLDPDTIHSVYFCGLEIEEPTGTVIVDFLEKNPQLTSYFAPGPRLTRIDPSLLERIFRLSPVLHLNRAESLQCTGASDLPEAARILFSRTGNAVIITLGSEGCCFYEGSGTDLQFVPGVPAIQKDTIGAGDSHIGAVIAARYLGYSLFESIRIANHISAKTVGVTGANLDDAQFQEALKEALP